MNPLIKYVGGKRRLLPELRSRLPAQFDRYIEPMAGGAALYFDLLPVSAVLCDVNDDLINLYFALRGLSSQLITELKYHANAHKLRGKTHYLETRAKFNAGTIDHPIDVRRAATFIYLNKTCYNGLWRVNSRGGFNVPMGRYTNPRICDEDAIGAISKALQGTYIYKKDILSDDFEDLLEIRAGDFVYLDPPYDETFTGYTKGGFGQDSHRMLAELAERMTLAGAKVMLSLSDTALMTELYEVPGSVWYVDRVDAPRSVSRNGADRKPVTELLVRNYT